MMELKNHIHYSKELEAAILGVCLLEKSAFGRVYELLEEQYFYSTGNQIVFASMKAMFQNSLPIDSYTVADHITRVKNIPDLEGDQTGYYLARLTNFVVSSAHLEYHSFIVKAMWMEREIISLTHSGTGEGNTAEKIRNIQDKLYQLQNKAVVHDWADMSELIVDLYRHQEEMKKTKGIGKPSGIKSLDKENGGFQDGQLIVIGARPSMGKSALAGGMAVEMSKNNLTVGIVSLEMSNNEIAARLCAYDTDTDFNVVYRGLYRDQEDTHRLYDKISKSTVDLKIFVTDKTKVNIPEIRAKAEKLKSLKGLDVLVIDYLQLVSSIGEKYNRNRENEIAEMSRGCKILAKEMNLPVIILCQLNREVTKRKGTERYPQLSDLRESGSLEQDADIVMFLHRDHMAGYETDENGNSTERQADLVVRKWRNGKSNFIIPLDFDPPKMKFIERTSSLFQAPIKNFYEKDEDPF